jgi:hypothetical protein
MSSGRGLAIGLIVAIIIVRAWFNGHLGAGVGALFGPTKGLGEA